MDGWSQGQDKAVTARSLLRALCIQFSKYFLSGCSEKRVLGVKEICKTRFLALGNVDLEGSETNCKTKAGKHTWKSRYNLLLKEHKGQWLHSERGARGSFGKEMVFKDFDEQGRERKDGRRIQTGEQLGQTL